MGNPGYGNQGYGNMGYGNMNQPRGQGHQPRPGTPPVGHQPGMNYAAAVKVHNY